ncbi:NADH-ubiquinone oxidoreductase 21.3 kDa subunit [Xylona heveae TC161]|uniref:NADH-ubiquinone oxidoreductase 21.3 kDa subunit n=1 Tax=Xylona heveae (strain CBS 132557 / TC161) TaxID=1328760 RepID=A0A165J302_XYLHT|nr:NADH-ubiquinone oxidoreductase 21.3 kDa subunit [Xylona heveae TC161]KZF25660.1 NADH-ubiquinone oxidoreductase 21.3 kDa subunit [Xylona heveae TC161]
MSGQSAAKAALSARGVVAVNKKYTVQSTGIWERIRRALAVDPNRSTGVPLNPLFRNPTPGGIDPKDYDMGIIVPAQDIAENPYWKRDTRRSYAQPSIVKPADVVGLLSVGSKAAPQEDKLQIGEAGTRQLTQIKEEGEGKGLSTFFENNKSTISNVLGQDGLPPSPANLARKSEGKKYEISTGEGYPEEYEIRTFV